MTFVESGVDVSIPLFVRRFDLVHFRKGRETAKGHRFGLQVELVFAFRPVLGLDDLVDVIRRLFVQTRGFADAAVVVARFPRVTFVVEAVAVPNLRPHPRFTADEAVFRSGVYIVIAAVRVSSFAQDPVEIQLRSTGFSLR